MINITQVKNIWTIIIIYSSAPLFWKGILFNIQMITVDGGGKNFQSTFSAYKYKGAWGSWPRFSKVTIWSISSILNDLNKICRGGVIEHVGTHTGEIPADAWFCNSNSAWLFISILTKIMGLEKYEDTNENNNNNKNFLKNYIKKIWKIQTRIQISNGYFWILKVNFELLFWFNKFNNIF